MTTAETKMKLTALDRCDRCNARAATVAQMPSGRFLYFCGHHANEHRETLVKEGAVLYDGQAFEFD